VLSLLPNLARNEKATKGFAQFASGRWRRPPKHQERFIKALQLEVGLGFLSHSTSNVDKIFSQKKIYFQLKNFFLFFSSLFLPSFEFFSDETSTINHQIGDPNFWHPPPSAGDNESNSYYSGAHPHSIHDLSRRTSVSCGWDLGLTCWLTTFSSSF
jgi:hypothetical protein